MFKRIWSTVFVITAIACLSSFAEAQTPKAEQMKLYVGNLSFQTLDDDLIELFSQAGEVKCAKVVVDAQTGRSRGFGYVVMATVAEGEAAIVKFNGTDFNGRIIEVKQVKGESRSCDEPDKSEPNQGKTEAPKQTETPKVTETPKQKEPAGQTETPRKDAEKSEKDGDSDEAQTIRIHIGNLSPKTIEEALREAFEEFGEAVSVKIEKTKQENQKVSAMSKWQSTRRRKQLVS